MRRKLKNLKHKSGHSENGCPRQLLDEAVYREHMASVVLLNVSAYDSEYSGWSNPSRPRDQAISIRSNGPGPRPPPPPS